MTSHTEPPRDLDERQTLVTTLDYFRGVFVRKSAGLTDEQLQLSLSPSSLTLGSLGYHMAFVEDYWFTHRFAGDPPPPPWASADWASDPDWEMSQAASLTGAEISAQYEESVGRSRAVLASEPALDTIAREGGHHGERTNLRWVLVHMIEEYARHCGHADFIRQSIDGATGD